MGAPSVVAARERTAESFLHGRYAPWLTHGSLILVTAAYFAFLLYLPFWIAFFPAVILAHRVGTLLHEYMHGIPFRRYRDNHDVVTLVDGLILMFGTLEMFRVAHLQHHRWLNTDEDAAFKNAQLRHDGGLRSTVAGVALVHYLILLWSVLAGREPQVRRGRMLLSALLSVSLVAAFVALGHADMVWKMLVVTAFTMLVPVSLRSAIEHHGQPGDHKFANEYRVWIPLFNLNRHIHHHEDPSIPWYLLQWRTERPLPRWHYVAYWFHVYVTRDYALMRPMRAADARRARGSRPFPASTPP